MIGTGAMSDPYLNRQYYYRKLDEHFLGIKEKYISNFGNAYDIPAKNSKELMKIIQTECNNHGIISDREELFQYMHTFEDKLAGQQMSLFDL